MMATPAHAVNVCSELNDLSNEVSNENDLNKDRENIFISRFYKSFINSLSSPKKVLGTASFEYGVTIDSGNSLIPSCEGLGAEPSLYYPIGTRVRILGVMKDVPNDGELKDHYYVIAEHGLRILIPQEDVWEIKDDKVYFFQDAPTTYNYCVRQDCSRDGADWTPRRTASPVR